VPVKVRKEGKGGWVSLFNGRDLTGWEVVGARGWSVKDGVLTADGRGAGWLASAKEYGDVEVELEYRLPPRGNSGMFLRAWKAGPIDGGQFLEIQLLDDGAFPDFHPTRRTGAIYGTVAPNPSPKLRPQDWNGVHVKAVGLRVQVSVNGTRVVNVNLDDHASTFARFPGLTRGSGRLGLQMLGTPVEFRNIRVRDLSRRGDR
jgi:hypothetical protein